VANVSVFAEQRDGKLKSASTDIISWAKSNGHTVSAVVIGKGIKSLEGELKSCGADKIQFVDDSTLEVYTPQAYSEALISVVKNTNPDYLLAAHTPMGRDLVPYVAMEMESSSTSDCTSVEWNGDSLKCRRPVFSGKATAEVEFIGNDKPKFITIRANTVPAGGDRPGEGVTTDHSVDLSNVTQKALGMEKGSSARPDVTEAAIVISGGRSLKSAENFKILEKLADLLGAAVGASRAAVDAGFRPHRDQVGQTGKVVSPSLYIACGISGAIQHLAGMRTSKCIVAINTDPEAPIFQVADYGIVGDLFEVVPALTEEIKKIR